MTLTPFNVSVNVSSQGLSFGGTYSGNSQLLTDSATGLFVGSYTMGNLGYQGFNGKLTPGSFALPFATGANVASSLINANGSLLNQIESQYGISGGIQITKIPSITGYRTYRTTQVGKLYI